jgi:hypothetical protein
VIIVESLSPQTLTPNEVLLHAEAPTWARSGVTASTSLTPAKVPPSSDLSVSSCTGLSSTPEFNSDGFTRILTKENRFQEKNKLIVEAPPLTVMFSMIQKCMKSFLDDILNFYSIREQFFYSLYFSFRKCFNDFWIFSILIRYCS